MTTQRCAPASLDRGDSQVGTASTVRAFLLVQQEGAWGPDALADSALPDEVATFLAQARRRTGIRPLLVRRHRRAEPGVRVFAAWTQPRGPWLEATTLDDVRSVLNLDVAALGRGDSLGLPRRDDPVVLACTHGAHDACCAVEGRPLAAALAATHPDLVWECSHLGGDRFAGNLLMLPDGHYYGRVDTAGAAGLVTDHLAGRLDLDHLRGRSGQPFGLQAAEHHLRTRLGLVAIDEVVATRWQRGDEVDVATLDTPDGTFEVAIRTVLDAPAVLTCKARAPSRGFHHELADLRRV